MKEFIKHDRLLFAGYFLLLLIPQSCLIYNSIIVENDIVYSLKRIKTEFYYSYSQEIGSPLIKLNQKVIKEINNKSDDYYTSYDLIILNDNSFSLEKNIFIIVDDQPFSVDIINYDADIVPSLNEEREYILTSDSTKVSVITGYRENQNREYRIAYAINNEIIEKIKTARKVMLRYYAGPDMITVKITKYDLNKLKRLIDAR